MLWYHNDQTKAGIQCPPLTFSSTGSDPCGQPIYLAQVSAAFTTFKKFIFQTGKGYTLGKSNLLCFSSFTVYSLRQKYTLTTILQSNMTCKIAAAFILKKWSRRSWVIYSLHVMQAYLHTNTLT